MYCVFSLQVPAGLKEVPSRSSLLCTILTATDLRNFNSDQAFNINTLSTHAAHTIPILV